MNATILAERTAKAVAAIEAETARLGGELSIQPTRGDMAHRHLHVLEAVAAALAEIQVPDKPTEKKGAKTADKKAGD